MGYITRRLILANVLGFILEQMFGDRLIAHFALWPWGEFELHTAAMAGSVGFQPWQLLTYAFLHAGLLHLFLNMFALYMFGPDIELTLGSRGFLALYAAAVVVAALVQLAVTTLAGGTPYPTVGASGGVFGVLLAFAVLFPRRRLLLIFPPIPLPAWLFVSLYGVIELASGVFGTTQGVAHFAHLGGMLGGYLVLRYLRRRMMHWP